MCDDEDDDDEDEDEKPGCGSEAKGGPVSALIHAANYEQHLDLLKDCDLVIESILEDLPTKKQLFNDLDRIVKDGAILATNTSTLPVVEMAMETGRPERVCGVHFFNPAPAMSLVEIVRAITRGCLRRDRKYLRALFRRRLALKLGFSKVLARYRALRDSAAEGKFP